LCFLQVNPYLLQNAVSAFSPFLAQALTGHQSGYSEIAVGTDCTGATSNPLTVMVPATTAYTPPSRSHRSDRMEAWILDQHFVALTFSCFFYIKFDALFSTAALLVFVLFG